MTPEATDAPRGVMTRVPNKPKTPMHSFRVDDTLWNDAKERAAAEGTDLSAVLRAFLKRYVGKGKRQEPGR